MANLVEELIIGLGFDVDEKELKDLSKGFKQMGAMVAKIAAAAAAATIGTVAFVTKTQIGIDDLVKEARIFGVSADELRRWQFAFEDITGSAGGAQSTLSAINDIQEKIARMDPGFITQSANALNQLGLNLDSLRGEKSDVIFRISDGIKRLRDEGASLETQRGFLRDLGFDPNTLELFASGSVQLRKAFKELSASQITQRQSDQAEKLAHQWAILKENIEGSTRAMQEEFTPALTTGLGKLNDFVLDNIENVKELGKEVRTFILGFLIGIDIISSKWKDLKKRQAEQRDDLIKTGRELATNPPEWISNFTDMLDDLKSGKLFDGREDGGGVGAQTISQLASTGGASSFVGPPAPVTINNEVTVVAQTGASAQEIADQTVKAMNDLAADNAKTLSNNSNPGGQDR